MIGILFMISEGKTPKNHVKSSALPSFYLFSTNLISYLGGKREINSIPNGGIFAANNVTAASFSGNNGLYGSILGRACVDLSPSKSPTMSTCRAFHCASIRIAVGCGAAGLLFVVLLLISLFMFRKRKFQIVSNGDASVTTFEGGLKISKDDLITIMSSPENVIGVGAKSTVYKGVLGGDQTVAIKTLSIHPNDSHHDYTQLEANLLSEALMVSKLRHQNVLKFLGCFRNEGIVALISQFMPMASLNDQLYPSSNDGSQTCELNWDVRLHIAVGIAHGLAHPSGFREFLLLVRMCF